MLLATSNEGWRNASELLGPGVVPWRHELHVWTAPKHTPAPCRALVCTEKQPSTPDKSWPFPNLSKWRRRELSHTSLGTFKSDWVQALCTEKTSLRVSTWGFWNPCILGICIYIYICVHLLGKQFCQKNHRPCCIQHYGYQISKAQTMTQFLLGSPAITQAKELFLFLVGPVVYTLDKDYTRTCRQAEKHLSSFQTHLYLKACCNWGLFIVLINHSHGAGLHHAT